MLNLNYFENILMASLRIRQLLLNQQSESRHQLILIEKPSSFVLFLKDQFGKTEEELPLFVQSVLQLQFYYLIGYQQSPLLVLLLLKQQQCDCQYNQYHLLRVSPYYPPMISKSTACKNFLKC